MKEPIRLRPLGLTSWTFIVNFLDIYSAAARSSTSYVLARFLRQRIKEARCTYVHTPYMKELISLRPPGLTSWTFIVNFLDICSAIARSSTRYVLARFLRQRIKEAHCTYVHTPYMKEPISLRPPGLTSWTFIVNFLDICSAIARSSTRYVLARFLRQRIKEAHCTYVHTPYMKEPISLRPLGLTSWTFIVI